MRSNNDLLQAALSYYERHWSVIPVHGVIKGRCTCGKPECDKPGKHPRISWKDYQHQRADELQIIQWWEQWPDSNIGIVTGKISQLVVVDIDGPKGEESLREAGLEHFRAPTVLTGGGGRHLYCWYSEQARTGAGILPKVDVRADGGFVVAPPSVYISGKVYQWSETAGLDLDIVEFPKVLLTHKNGTPRSQSRVDWSAKLEKGERNAMLTERAGSLLGKSHSRDDTLEILLAINQAKCHPPLPEDEVRRIVNSIAEREERKQGLDKVNALLGVPTPISGVRKWVSDNGEGRWDLILQDGGTIEIGSTSKLLNFAHVRARIADTTGHLIDVKRGMFGVVVQAVLDAAEEVFDSGPREEMIEWLRGLIENYRIFMGHRNRSSEFAIVVHDMKDNRQRYTLTKKLQNPGPKEPTFGFDTDGRVYLRLGSGTMWHAHMLKPRFDSANTLAGVLQKLLGFKAKKLDYSLDGARAHARVQVSEPGLLEELDIPVRPWDEERDSHGLTVLKGGRNNDCSSLPSSKSKQ